VEVKLNVKGIFRKVRRFAFAIMGRLTILVVHQIPQIAAPLLVMPILILLSTMVNANVLVKILLKSIPIVLSHPVDPKSQLLALQMGKYVL